ncbi:MAG: septal ring lytic transglycosylase RlpA family protein [Solirubrobacteraceae bacterium]
MHTVSLKHALVAGLLAALLGIAGPFAMPAARALAETNSTTSGGAAPTPGSVSKQTVATWYGPGFYGHTTACGQKLTPKLVGVASRTLPCGTLVRISYGGHMLTAPVLDRGPYGHSGAVWDLTSGAARALAIRETVRIGTQIVGSVPNSPALGQSAFSTTLSPTSPTSTSSPSESPTGSSPAAQASATTGGATAS